MFNRADRVMSHLDTGDFPELDWLRIIVTMRSEPSPERAAFAHDYLTRPGVTDVENAKKFDHDWARTFGYEFASEDHVRRARLMRPQ